MLGREGQRRLQTSRVLVWGLSGTGVEVAKNVALAGVSEIVLYDPTPSTMADLATNFYIREGHVAARTSRAAACLEEIRSLNPHVKVSVMEAGGATGAGGAEGGDGGVMAKVRSGAFSVVVAADHEHELSADLNDAAREGKAAFVGCGVKGLFGRIFCDFGDEFVVNDPTGR